MQDIFYVYLLIDPITNIPFYVGKGKNKRAYHHMHDSYKSNKLKYTYIKNLKLLGHNPIIEFIKRNLKENDAFELEKRLIEKYGRVNNKTGCRYIKLKREYKGFIWENY